MEQSVSKVGEQGRTSSELTTGRITISIKMHKGVVQPFWILRRSWWSLPVPINTGKVLGVWAMCNAQLC
jgi:hypothetical protein